MTIATHNIRSPRGTSLTCKGWPQEAALRMLKNNLDPDVAELPEDLGVYGGSGRAARRVVAAGNACKMSPMAPSRTIRIFAIPNVSASL